MAFSFQCAYSTFSIGRKEYLYNTDPVVLPAYTMAYALGLNTVFSALLRHEKVVIIPTAGAEATELMLSMVQKYKVRSVDAACHSESV